jgi:hypothetical protein
MDIYHRPEGQREPRLWKAMRIIAQNDAEAIREAERSFESRSGDISSLTGFALRRVGFRRTGDRLIHQYVKSVQPDPVSARG